MMVRPKFVLLLMALALVGLSSGYNMLVMNAIDPCSHVIAIFPLTKELGGYSVVKIAEQNEMKSSLNHRGAILSQKVEQ